MEKEKITLLDGKEWEVPTLLEYMISDEFYYGFCGKNMLSKSIISGLVPPKSPKAWWYQRNAKKESKSLIDGRLFHMAILEPEKYEKLKFSKYKTRCKTHKDQQAQMTDRLYTQTEKEDSEKLQQAFAVNKKAVSKLKSSKSEVPGVGLIEGLPFRAKADCINSEGKIIDLKTCQFIGQFPEDAERFGYDMQVFIYCEIFGIKPRDFEFIAISKNTLDIKFAYVDDSFYEQGKEKTLRAIEQYYKLFHQKEEEEIKETINELYYEQTLYGKKND